MLGSVRPAPARDAGHCYGYTTCLGLQLRLVPQTERYRMCWAVATVVDPDIVEPGCFDVSALRCRGTTADRPCRPLRLAGGQCRQRAVEERSRWHRRALEAQAMAPSPCINVHDAGGEGFA